MKKAVIFALIICILLSLSSCLATIDLDEMKENHARYEDENHEAIIFRGKRFILPEAIEAVERVNFTEDGYITDPDVPTLLSISHGKYFSYNDQLTFIRVSNESSYVEDYYDYSYNDYDDEWVYYIREDFIEEFEGIVKGKTDHLCYYVDWQEQPVILTDKQRKAVYATISTSPIGMGYEYDVGDFDLYYCDPTFTIVDLAFTVHKGSYDNYYIITDNSSHAVPIEYRDDIVSIVQNIKHKQKNNESN